MSTKINDNKKRKKMNRLSRLLGVDLCACCGGHQRKCEGVCRDAHRNPITNRVECGELYHIDTSEVRVYKSRNNKKDDDDNVNEKLMENKKDARRNRRQKISRDRGR